MSCFALVYFGAGGRAGRGAGGLGRAGGRAVGGRTVRRAGGRAIGRAAGRAVGRAGCRADMRADGQKVGRAAGRSGGRSGGGAGGRAALLFRSVSFESFSVNPFFFHVSALRVSPAETRLTVYRRLSILLRSDRPSSGVREDR